MKAKITSIPIKPLIKDLHEGISISEISLVDEPLLQEADRPHRHDFHFFLLQKNGKACFEIDFKNYNTAANTILYVHPDQVHRFISVKDVTFYVLAIKNEFLNSEYLNLLDDITPVNPLVISEDDVGILTNSISLCLRLSEQINRKLYSSSLKDSCNTYISLFIAQYLENTKPIEKYSRFEIVTKEFKQLLERNYSSNKRPSDFAQLLNISTPYLNQCVKNTTGFSVSHHIQQRVILEAKRLLFHSDSSIKEIANNLGFDDYAYFSRLFSKLSGISPIAFRQKKID